ncbi:MAG TPA: bifunctional riboflavin kinase/FAD synthetase [Verrucomicrobiota bacterium]|nr:bifunctional riboflavin kinase/FAD synthetase [Verrucomicrobiota bacterium]
MKIVRSTTELTPGKICLAIGVFDGVHLGHQQIIRQTVADGQQHEAASVVVTFDKHPNVVVAPDRVPPQIYSRRQKLRAIEALGVSALLEIPFDTDFSRQTGEQFIRSLARDFGKIQSICVGTDFVFGHKRSGDVALLRTLGRELQFSLHGIAAVSLDGQPVSSTRIREAIRSGDFDAASQMLGRAYSFAGVVLHGDQLGHQLGFPTANLDTTGLVLPAGGVYAAHAMASGKAHRAVLNIGHRPTLKSPTPETRVEVHLLDYSGDLYGQELEIAFVGKLRDERKFASLDELKTQIARDIAEARRRF